uniref:hypothetical protein n=1 Tax=Stenotrophomonas maltophilia TaxID=40324 RepID=UPI001954FF35
QERRLDMQHLNMIEGNPLTPDEVEMFAMFERERWANEQRFAYLDELTREMLEKSKSGNLYLYPNSWVRKSRSTARPGR